MWCSWKLYFYYEHSGRFNEQDPLFRMLAQPDSYLCACESAVESQAILDVFTNALNIRICLWHKDSIYCKNGPVTTPDFHLMVLSQLGHCQHRFRSLVEDQSGKCLIDYIVAKQMEQLKISNGLNIDQVMWYRYTCGRKPICYNGNRIVGLPAIVEMSTNKCLG